MPKTDSTPMPYKRAGVQLNRNGQLGWRLRATDPRTGRQPEKVFWGTERQAIVALAEHQAEVAGAQVPALTGHRTIRLSDWSVRWLADYQWKVRPVGQNAGVRRPETTWRKERAIVSAYVAPSWLGKKTVASISYDDCYEFIAGLRVDGGKSEASASTKETVASTLRKILAGAHAAGVTGTDVAASLPFSWGAAGRRRVVLPSLRQVEALATELDERWTGRGDIVRVLAYTGLRWEELSALTWDDIDRERANAQVYRTRPSATGRLVDSVKTPSSGRFITLLDQVAGPLDRLEAFAQERGSSWVLTGERGGPLAYGTWRKRLDPARQATGVQYTAHQLRHVAVSLLIAGGADLRLVADQVGHSRTAVTEQVYRHMMNLDRRELARQLSLAVTTVEVDEMNP